jgi:ubiquinone/menaquinone biosynthesis C-methylase UbiE
MEHLKRITDEFTRQAQTFEVWAEQADTDVGGRFAAALGEAARGRLIDVACGPGVVTAALAPNATSVVAFDATEEMLGRAEARCAKAGLGNVEFKIGDAENLPFADAQFDGAVTRAALHHFAHPRRAVAEMFRVLRPGGVAAFADVVSSENADESRLHNAIERLRDPSHVRMLPASELDSAAQKAGFRDLQAVTWDAQRELEEWFSIVRDPDRVEPIRTVVRALAESARTAGIGLSVKNGQVVFFHRWRMLRAEKPGGAATASAADANTAAKSAQDD